jgi:hypothetical protein
MVYDSGHSLAKINVGGNKKIYVDLTFFQNPDGPRLLQDLMVDPSP